MKRVLIAAAVAAGLSAPAVLSSTVGATVAHRLPAAGQAQAASSGRPTARVGFSGGGRPIPSGFFGLSIEYNELHTYEQSGVLFHRFLQLVRPENGTALTLRLGGKSADHMLWEPDAKTAPKLRSLPHGVFELGDTWLKNLVALVKQNHLRIILDLNLAVHSPSMAASFARAVRTALPAGSVAALEIGNEPDEYHFQPRLTGERVASTTRSTPRHWWSNYSAGDYRRDYVAYGRALHASVPGLRLGAPDITRPNPPWLTELANLRSLRPAFLAIHRYATSGCFPVGSSAYPTIANLLANRNSEGLAASVAPWVRYAHARGIGLRVSEINSDSCGKDRGVADAFASALWAPDVLFAMLRTGVNAVSWHIRPWPLNAPFHFNRAGIRPEPELYALALFAKMTQGPARLMSSSVHASKGVHLQAWAVRSGRTVRVLLINKGWQAVHVSLAAGRHRGAQLRWLTAPGVRASGGVRFAGQRIGSDVRWKGKPHVMDERARGGRVHLRVGPYSEAFVTL